jgi:hypothetical protein
MMNAYLLPDNHSNVYMIESEVGGEEFSDLLYTFCSDNYSKYQGNYHNIELHYDALENLVKLLKYKGYKSRVIKPILEQNIWGMGLNIKSLFQVQFPMIKNQSWQSRKVHFV